VEWGRTQTGVIFETHDNRPNFRAAGPSWCNLRTQAKEGMEPTTVE